MKTMKRYKIGRKTTYNVKEVYAYMSRNGLTKLNELEYKPKSKEVSSEEE